MSHIRFRIEYATVWGESLWVNYHIGDGTANLLLLSTDDGHTWWGEIDAPAYTEVRYTYCVKDGECRTVRSLREGAFRVNAGPGDRICMYDRWIERDLPAEMLHSAFTDCVYGGVASTPVSAETSASPYLLKLHAVPPPAGCRWAVCGTGERLGAWRPDAVKPLRRTATYEWSLPLTEEDFISGAQYKYVLVREGESRPVLLWEDGENRRIESIPLYVEEGAVVNDDMPRLDLPGWRGAGVVIPVFSLRSKGSQGIGDFGDLRNFVLWAASVGFRAVQLLPINDTTSSASWHDSYPYNGISVFALHPLYLDMREWRELPIYEAYAEKAEKLNAKAVLDYEGVLHLKMDFLSELYVLNGKAVMARTDYMDFFAENRAWLMPYARYSFEKVQQLHYVHADSVDFFCYVQYLLHRQMQAAHDEARANGVILKGDIPIGVSRDSVPAKVDRHLFHFDGQAGAPPDAFARHGQNWGFPTYNWEEMARDNYAWWRKRLAHMGNYFDAYRIDHVLGFFRIWEVPAVQTYGILGHFRPALPLSEGEIRAFGFASGVSYYAVARITPERMAELKAELHEEDLSFYFTAANDGTYELKGTYATQRKILEKVPEGALRDALMDIVCEVLFLPDPDGSGYHPRIGAQDTHIFKTLTNSDRDAFNRLHDDFFYVRHNAFWAQKAMEKLPVIVNASQGTGEHSMLPCAEDLGMVPASVKGVLDELHVLSLEIQRMPKEYGVRFGNLQHNPYRSVATIATHDMPPFRLWWHENREQTQAFWAEVLGGEGEAPADATPEVCEQVVKMHLDSPSMLCLNALQDYLAIDGTLRRERYEEEQINVPANPFHYWQYRMHLNIEDLSGATAFNEKLRGLVASSGRRV